MRDPARIDVILKKIETIWKKYPDQRLMQLLLNACGHHQDHFYLEDDDLVKKLNRFEEYINMNYQQQESKLRRCYTCQLKGDPYKGITALSGKYYCSEICYEVNDEC